MATRTECPDCGKHYSGKRCACGFTRLSVATPSHKPAWNQPEWMRRPPPCTPEENHRALHLVKAIVDRDITSEQARRVLNEMFLGRELEL